MLFLLLLACITKTFLHRPTCKQNNRSVLHNVNRIILEKMITLQVVVKTSTRTHTANSMKTRAIITPLAVQLHTPVVRFMVLYGSETSITVTRSSAVAEGPRNALWQLKSCQLLHNCT